MTLSTLLIAVVQLAAGAAALTALVALTARRREAAKVRVRATTSRRQYRDH